MLNSINRLIEQWTELAQSGNVEKLKNYGLLYGRINISNEGGHFYHG